VLKGEARSLRGKLSLDPGDPPAVIVRPWPLRMALRELLLQAPVHAGRAAVSSGGGGKRAWVRIALPAKPQSGSPELALCRKILKSQGGQLRIRGRVVTLTLPVAG
jgi:hypothetical protein